MLPTAEKHFWTVFLVLMGSLDYFEIVDPSVGIKKFSAIVPYIVVGALVCFFSFVEKSEVVPGLFDFRPGQPSKKYEVNSSSPLQCEDDEASNE
jgi:hypothetical protein